jgi:hypothetical protein
LLPPESETDRFADTNWTYNADFAIFRIFEFGGLDGEPARPVTAVGDFVQKTSFQLLV